MTLHATLTVESATALELQPHLQAALDAATAAGLDVERAPSTASIDGDDEQVVEAVSTVLRAALEDGATLVGVEVRVTAREG